jgi:hypothetical protein
MTCYHAYHVYPNEIFALNNYKYKITLKISCDVLQCKVTDDGYINFFR